MRFWTPPKSKARATYLTYNRLLNRLRPEPWPLTPAICRSYLPLAKSDSTILTTAGALRAFIKFCRREGWLYEDIRFATPQRDKDRPHRYLSDAEVERLLAGSGDLRLAIHLLLTGLRAAELLSLSVSDIDDGLILVKGKGSRWRYVPLPREAIPLLPESGKLVTLPYHTLLRRLARLGVDAGIPRVHPHLFRHTFGTRAVQGLDIPTVQAVMGHASSEMSEHYAKSVYKRAAARKAARLFE